MTRPAPVWCGVASRRALDEAGRSQAIGPAVLVHGCRGIERGQAPGDGEEPLYLVVRRQGSGPSWLLGLPARPILPPLARRPQGVALPAEMGAVVEGYVAAMLAHADRGAVVESLVEGLGGFLAFALDATGQAPADERAEVRAKRLREALLLIERHLREPDLSPEWLARRMGISLRHLHKLFEDSGRTVSQTVMARRLEACRRAIEDPAQAWRTFSDIALQHGFADLAHFSRRFREAFGLSPREARRQATARPREEGIPRPRPPSRRPIDRGRRR